MDEGVGRRRRREGAVGAESGPGARVRRGDERGEDVAPRRARRRARRERRPAALRRGAREGGRRPGRSRRRRPAAAREFSGFFFGFFFFFFFFAPVRPSRSVRGRGRSPPGGSARRRGARRSARSGAPPSVARTPWRRFGGFEPGRRLRRRAPGERRLAVVEGLASIEGRDRVAQASARFLAEYLRAVAADPGGPGDAGDGDEPQPLDASEKKKTSSERRDIVSDAELGAAWASFATEHLPACASHPSPLVRAASMAAVSGLGARATRAIARETLAETARVSLALLTAPDAPPAQRAAAARATGVVAALLAPGSESASSGPAAASEDPSPTPAHTPGAPSSPSTPPLDLVPMFDALVRACGDASKSVKLPASWAAANACAGLASAAEENRREKRAYERRRRRRRRRVREKNFGESSHRRRRAGSARAVLRGRGDARGR